MKTLERILLIAIVLTFPIILYGQKRYTENTKMTLSHPRILLLEGEEKFIQDRINTNSTLKRLHLDILEESNNLIELPVLERKQIGRRLLSVSREAIRRIFFLSYSYRMTEDKKYFDRAQKELLAVSNFSDWNQSHFLDVAEMTLGVSIGYDWLYKNLSPQSRAVIKAAIISKGISPSFNSKDSGFLKATHNWNQVCNTGMTYGALAVYEDIPDLASYIIDRAIESIRLPMKDYAPSGSYPEGYGYWDYGTSFNVLFLSAIEKIFKTDYGLSNVEGFMETAYYFESMIGPTGKAYNYSDSGQNGNLSPAMFWFANKKRDNSLLWIEKVFLDNERNKRYLKNRILPAIMIWSANIDLSNVRPPSYTTWTGHGTTPVTLMRTSWIDPNAIYVGFKGGTASSNHAHMDAGSFIMEANGIRWAMDFGSQDYESLESKGINIWGRTQSAQRWEVFRYNNMAHNTLTINNEYHRVEGHAPIVSTSDDSLFMSSVVDLSTVLEDQVQSAKRGIAIADKKYVVVRDEITTNNNKETTIRWTMLTPANAKITGNNSITLTKDNKKLKFEVLEPANVKVKTWSTKSKNDWDADNTGTIFIGFDIVVPANTTIPLTVVLVPQGTKYKKTEIKPLTAW